eukprot:COSAG06_NODE_40520_length_401_cov_0.857616_1_plen_22_part_10
MNFSEEKYDENTKLFVWSHTIK